MPGEAPPLPPIELTFPRLAQWAAGNIGIPYVWRHGSEKPGPRATLQALTHGNEVCGAIALDWLLRSGFRPTRGTLTVVFANVAAYETFDSADPFASRCIDEDFNRLWSADVLDSARRTSELDRARQLRPVYDASDVLLDLHSMTDISPPLSLAGRQAKGLALARALGLPAHIVLDAGHQSGRRLRDYSFFDDPADARNALLIECGQHWERAAPVIAQQAVLRLLRHLDMAAPAFLEQYLDTTTLPPQRAIEVTDAIAIQTDSFEFAFPVSSLDMIRQADTLLAHDGERDIRTPYDNCVLIMPNRRPRKGETAVRLGRVVA